MREKKPTLEREIMIPFSKGELGAFLHVPSEAKGVVLFVHGSGSSRFSPRNQHVAAYLQEEKIATLLFDLLTPEEEREDLKTQALRFDIPFLAARLLEVSRWVNQAPETRHLTLGYFGASTGAGAALVAAADLPNLVKAVVSRGGRPDCAGERLPRVMAPTLLIVGGADTGVLELNQQALALLTCPKRLEIVPDATHLFEESGALDRVASIAAHWFKTYL